ncbi:unnamed protein product [Litomosoides sigmodontis]|uniref:Uncharacterized protein n=1 Tax=Litomosoides sigmodontis TaxID=42156 RepID=A0A3P6SE45_LITSI|nr:unnamed protein product [Litomosoides sigmodontis]
MHACRTEDNSLPCMKHCPKDSSESVDRMMGSHGMLDAKVSVAEGRCPKTYFGQRDGKLPGSWTDGTEKCVVCCRS